MKQRIFRWRLKPGKRSLASLAAMGCWLAMAPASNWAGTIGKVVPIGGHASDLALDEARGVLYVANFTANRVEVVSVADGSIQRSLNVAAQPSSLALSPDGRYLVVAHYGNFKAPAGSPNNGLTVIDVEGGGRSTYVLGSAPLGVAFGIDNRALVATTSEFLLFDPVSGATLSLGTVPAVTTKSLPQPLGEYPSNIVAASMVTSADGLWVVGSAAVSTENSGGGGGGGASVPNQTLEFVYDVTSKRVNAVIWTWSPTLGPRAVSTNFDGSLIMKGWAMHDRRLDVILNQLPNAKGTFHVGSHVFDNKRGLIYAQFESETPGGQQQARPAPILQVLEADNLTVRERWQLPENLAGKSIMNSDSSVIYGISESGVLMIPVGDNPAVRRIVASKEDVIFRGNYCDRRVSSQEVTLIDPSGANTDFALKVTTPGVSVTPSSGVTPATVRINVDPNAFQNQKGTVTVNIEISSKTAVNLPDPIRVLINNREPDQRGAVVNVPGRLVDLLHDPQRDRFYVLRQDKNQVLVFDGASQTPIATLRTGNTPTQMAITFDRRWLLVGHDNAQLIRVYDLETLEESLPIRMPGGHYPRSVAASAKAILAASRVAGPKHKISRVDFASRIATELPTLGVYENDIHVNTILVATPNGSSIMAAQADGKVFLYSANQDTFTVSRKDYPSLSGAYAASSFDYFVVGNNLLNASLVPVAQFETGTGKDSGFAFLDQGGFRTTAPDSASPGIIQRVNPASGVLSRSTRMVEAPVLPVASGTGTAAAGGQSQAWQQIFTRSVAPLYSRNAIINLTTSGFTVLPWNFDDAVAPPRIERVVNAADLMAPIAPGSLISIFGSDLSPIQQGASQMPLPSALGETCLTVNGLPVPVVFVSPRQINGQMPFQAEGNMTLILRTPGGVSDNFNLTVLPTAPGVFRNGVAGDQRELPAVYRAANGLLVTLTNPIHRGDMITIYLTGLGRTTPSVEAGVPAPGDPPARVLVPPVVRLGGVELPVEFAGLAPGSVGVYLINARVRHDVPVGFDQILEVSQGSGSTSISVRVVD